MQKINVNTIQPGDNPPATCQDAPVLIELEELRLFLKDGVDFHAPKTTIMNHFSQPSNQYRPSEQKPVEEWVPEVGDQVITQYLCSPNDRLGLRQDLHGKTGNIDSLLSDKIYMVHGVSWGIKSLTLIKKVDSPGTVIPVASDDVEQPLPIDLATAKELYKQGGAAAEVALEWYSEAELTIPALPVSWQNIVARYGVINGVDFEDADKCEGRTIFPTVVLAKAALAANQLDWFRKAWLEIEAPEWVPDWKAGNTQIKHIIVRENEELGHLAGCHRYSHFSFPNFKLAQRFLTTFPDLLHQAFCIKQNPGE